MEDNGINLQECHDLMKQYGWKKNLQQSKELINSSNSIEQWKKNFIFKYVAKKDRNSFQLQLKTLLEKSNNVQPIISSFVAQYKILKPVRITLRKISSFKQIALSSGQNISQQIDLKICQNIKNSLSESQDIQGYFEKELLQILDILQRKYSLLKYYNYFISIAFEQKTPLSQKFKSLSFIDFIIFLLKLTDKNDEFIFLMARQGIPIPITQQNTIKLCRSFLKSDHYPLITIVGTKKTLMNKNKITGKLLLVDEKYIEKSIFQENFFNIFLKDNIVIIDYDISLKKIQQIPFSRQTSLLILHILHKDLEQGFIQKNSASLQNIQRLIIFVWDGQSLQKQDSLKIVSQLGQNSIIRKSIKQHNQENNLDIIKQFIQVISITSQNQQFSHQKLTQFIYASMKYKKFAIQQHYLNKQKQITQFLQKSSEEPNSKLLSLQQLSPFLSKCSDYINEKQYIQFILFHQKILKINQITVDNVISCLDTLNQQNIDKKAQRPNSILQQKINNYYQKCFSYGLPFSIIERKSSIFGLDSLQRYIQYFQQTVNKKIFIISVFGEKSENKNIFLNQLFGYNFYMTNLQQGGLYVGLCETDEYQVLILDGYANIKDFIGQDKEQIVFNRQLLVFLLKVSNIVLFTHFQQNYSQLIKQIRICYKIAEIFYLNQGSRERCLSKMLFALSQDIEINAAKKILRKTSQLQQFIRNDEDIFTVKPNILKAQREKFGSFILGFRNYILNILKSSQHKSKNYLIQNYNSLKAEWQNISFGVSSKIFGCNDSDDLEFFLKQTAEYRTEYPVKKNQLINQFFTSLNKKPLENIKEQIQQIIKQTNFSLEEVNSQSYLLTRIRQLVDKITNNDFINTQVNGFDILSNNLKRYHKNYISQQCFQLFFGYLQKGTNQLFKSVFNQSIDKSYQDLLRKVNQYIEKFDHLTIIFRQQRLNFATKLKNRQQSSINDLIYTFETIFQFQQILSNLQFDNIYSCIQFYQRISKDLPGNLIKIIAIQRQSMLSYLEKAKISTMIQDQLAIFKKKIQNLYPGDSGSMSQIILLQKFKDLLLWMNENTEQTSQILKQKSNFYRNQLSLFKINYKKCLVALIHQNTKIHMAKDKLKNLQKKQERIFNHVKQMMQNKKILLKFQQYYNNIKQLLKSQIEGVLRRYKQKLQNQIQKIDNIVVIALRRSIDFQNKKQQGKNTSYSIQSIINCFKIVKNPQRYLDQIKSQQILALDSNFKQQLQYFQTQIQKLKKKIHKFKYQPKLQEEEDKINLPNELNQVVQAKKQSLISQTVELLEKEMKKQKNKIIKRKVQASVCQHKCQKCNARCQKQRKNQQDHNQHEIKHLLYAFGAPSIEKHQFSVNICKNQKPNSIVKDYQKKLQQIWAKIEDVINPIQEASSNPKPNKQIKKDSLTLTQLKQLKLIDY